MPKGRMLNKKVCFDEKVSQLSLKATILFTFCIPNLDVEGKILADLHYLKGNIVPYREDFSIKDIQKCIIELSESSLVLLYGNGHKYMKFLGFEKNQNIRTDRESPSEIPDPTPAELQQYSSNTPAQVKLKLNISKDKYKDEVFLSKEEYQKLVSRFGLEITEKCINKLDNYKGSNGKKYKSDYKAILNWVVESIKKDTPLSFNTDPLAGIKK